jgi:phosphatidylglycerol:prolipoprotein diacylglycerol transferase
MHSLALIPAFAYWVNALDHPVLLHIWGPVAIRWYGVAYLAGFLCGYALWRLAVKRAATNVSVEQIEELLVWSIAGVLVGGRLGYMLFYDFGSFVSDPLILFRVYEGGMSFHGGLLGVVIALMAVTRLRKLPYWQVADLAAMATPFGLFFGRLANFFNGELWGKITDSSWGMVFLQAPYDPKGYSVKLGGLYTGMVGNPRHPSQLYEAALEGVLLGAVMLFLYWRRKSWLPQHMPGMVSGVFLSLYAVSRIICEIFREPDASLILGLSRGTFYSVLMLLSGLLVTGYAYLSYHRKGGLPDAGKGNKVSP